MKLQTLSQRPGTQSVTTFNAKLIKHQIKAKRKGIHIEDAFVQEVLAYVRRNAQVFSKTAGHICCSACLKAHITQTAHLHKYPLEVTAYLTKIVPGKQGHEGYYLDDSVLIKLPEF